jgi:hypothetical protein
VSFRTHVFDILPKISESRSHHASNHRKRMSLHELVQVRVLRKPVRGIEVWHKQRVHDSGIHRLLRSLAYL